MERLPHPYQGMDRNRQRVPGEFLAVLRAHYLARQALQPRDVYKLIYQRVFGPEHFVDRRRVVLERLYLEVLQLPETPAREPVMEALSPDLCRVNLHPFVQQDGNLKALGEMFCRTAREYQPGTLADMQRAWRLFLSSPWARGYAPARLEQFWQCLATANFPPVHHSRAYAEANTPHYRVVLRALAAEQSGYPAMQ